MGWLVGEAKEGQILTDAVKDRALAAVVVT